MSVSVVVSIVFCHQLITAQCLIACAKKHKSPKHTWYHGTILQCCQYNFLMMCRQTKWIIKNHKALPSASVDKWGCHIKSGTRVDEVSLTLRHSVILDDVVCNYIIKNGYCLFPSHDGNVS